MRWEKHWLEGHGTLVAATPHNSAKRAWPAAARPWAASKRQLIEGVIWQLKDYFGLERHRAKTRLFGDRQPEDFDGRLVFLAFLMQPGQQLQVSPPQFRPTFLSPFFVAVLGQELARVKLYGCPVGCDERWRPPRRPRRPPTTFHQGTVKG